MTLATPKTFTLEEYHHLIEIGFFDRNDRIELIRGELIKIAAKGTAHSVCEMRLERALYSLIGNRATLRGQQPITLPNNSEPEPDRAIVRNRDDDYLNGHPTPEDILLVIEVSDRTLNFERTVKMPLYAEAKIGNYWIFNLVDRILECYSEPYQNDGDRYSYRTTRIFLPNESVTLPEFSDLLLDLSTVFLPPKL